MSHATPWVPPKLLLSKKQIFVTIETAAAAYRGTAVPGMYQQGWLGLAWFGLAWLGLAWLGLAWLGLAWLGLAWLGLAGLAWLGLRVVGLTVTIIHHHAELPNTLVDGRVLPAKACLDFHTKISVWGSLTALSQGTTVPSMLPTHIFESYSSMFCNPVSFSDDTPPSFPARFACTRSATAAKDRPIHPRQDGSEQRPEDSRRAGKARRWLTGGAHRGHQWEGKAQMRARLQR